MRSSTGRGPAPPHPARAMHHCAPADEEEHSGVTEPQRLALHAAARTTLGTEEADALMSLPPPANSEIAVRHDVTGLGTERRSEVAQLGTELHGEIAACEARSTLHMSESLRRSTVWTVGLVLTMQTATITVLTSVLA